MSRRRKLGQRLKSLEEIAGILSAMKNLALMETHLLNKTLPSQHQLVAGIEQTAAELLAWQPQLASPVEQSTELCLLVGSEQPFCGDYNEQLVNAFTQLNAPAVVLGQRLADRLEGQEQVIKTVSGATITEEIPATLMHLTDTLSTLMRADPRAQKGLSALYHNAASGSLEHQQLLPLGELPPPPATPFAPDLQLSPEHLWSAINEHYLYAALNRVLYSALLAENRQRLSHMEQALKRIDERSHELEIAYNAERQEEIIEEIEVIVLSADLLGDS